MPRRHDHPRNSRRVEHPLFLVEVPAARLLRHQPPLQPVGEPRHDPAKARHLLVEVSAQPRQFILVAQLGRAHRLIEAVGERAIVAARLLGPVALARVAARLLGPFISFAGFAVVEVGVAVRTVVLAVVGVAFLRAHLHVAARGAAIAILLLGFVLALILARILVPALVGFGVAEVLGFG